MVFVFSLLDCCALIFLSVYFVSLPETGGGRPGALRGRDRAQAGPGWEPGQVCDSERGGGRGPPGQVWRARAGGGPSLHLSAQAAGRPAPGGPSGPLSGRAPAWPTRRRSPPRCPDPPCSERGRLMASSRSSGERGRGLLPFRPSREQGPRFFLAPGPGPLSEAGRGCVCVCVWVLGGWVPKATALVPGMVARGHRGAGTSGGDLPPLVILWATPPPPGSLFSRVLELVGTLHIQESTRFKNGRGASFAMPFCRECWEGFI